MEASRTVVLYKLRNRARNKAYLGRALRCGLYGEDFHRSAPYHKYIKTKRPRRDAAASSHEWALLLELADLEDPKRALGRFEAMNDDWRPSLVVPLGEELLKAFGCV